MEQKTLTQLKDALNNIGLPQLAQKLSNEQEFTKDDFRTIKDTIQDMDNYYIDGTFTQSDNRKALTNFVNEYCFAYRWYSLIIK